MRFAIRNRKSVWRLLTVLSLSVFVLLAARQSANASEELAKRLEPLIEAHKGDVGVMVQHLDTGESFAHQADEPMPTASLIKFPIMIAVYQAIEEGKLELDKMLTLKESDKVPGSGILTAHFSGGTRISLHDAIHLMMSYSDNTATNLVIEEIGLEATAEKMKELDCPNTVLHSLVYRRKSSIFPERSREFGLGSTTAAEMVKLLEMLHKKELVSQNASEEMLEQMSAIGSNAMFPRMLPEGVKLIHKTGGVSAARTDAGLILSANGPIALCVLTNNNDDQRWTDDNGAEMLCSSIAKEVYEHFNPSGTVAEEEESSTLKLGDNGLIVEAVQRTLNARLDPSPKLSVDGDFGPMTQQALIDFQKSKNLEEEGFVGPETWKALGTLEEEDHIPDPEVINAEVIEKTPADDLSGPPFVTCKAWVVGDGETGEVLWGHRENEPLDMASTTKMMTGYLITSLAEKDPAVLEETIVFSKRADETIGSTSGVRAGEKVKVGELLYGLLLPSGNDASVALAEHFGARLSEDSDSGDPYNLFVAAMNRRAKEIGMKDTHFVNTHGLTEKDHKASAADLMTLAHHALQQPLFREIVGTAQRGCTIIGPGGYQRNLLWRSTNRLLRIAGFGGVKTGTTRAAGSCLVSQGTRGDRSLLVVVLGSSSTDARYVDSKNLYRFAWRQLGFGDEQTTE